MRRILPILAAILTLSGAAYAQVPGNSPAMGATSPLGVLGATTAPATSGIPLGATEINPGGLSPMPLTTCATTSTATTNGTFDGGGLTGCTATTSQPSLSGTASPLTTPGSDPTQSGSAIPLNATEITNGGISPLIVAPSTTPTMMVTPTMTTTPTMRSPTMTAPGLGQ
jgi:hypothetical protein